MVQTQPRTCRKITTALGFMAHSESRARPNPEGRAQRLSASPKHRVMVKPLCVVMSMTSEFNPVPCARSRYCWLQPYNRLISVHSACQILRVEFGFKPEQLENEDNKLQVGQIYVWNSVRTIIFTRNNKSFVFNPKFYTCPKSALEVRGRIKGAELPSICFLTTSVQTIRPVQQLVHLKLSDTKSRMRVLHTKELPFHFNARFTWTICFMYSYRSVRICRWIKFKPV